MLRFLTDADFHGDITRGLLDHQPGLDLIRVQDVGLRQSIDPIVLEWAADDGRVVLTHDVNTMIRFAYERVRLGQRMPGLFVVPQSVPVGQAIQEILIVVQCSDDGEWEGQVLHLPL